MVRHFQRSLLLRRSLDDGLSRLQQRQQSLQPQQRHCTARIRPRHIRGRNDRHQCVQPRHKPPHTVPRKNEIRRGDKHPCDENGKDPQRSDMDMHPWTGFLHLQPRHEKPHTELPSRRIRERCRADCRRNSLCIDHQRQAERIQRERQIYSITHHFQLHQRQKQHLHACRRQRHLDWDRQGTPPLQLPHSRIQPLPTVPDSMHHQHHQRHQHQPQRRSAARHKPGNLRFLHKHAQG